MLTVHHYEVTVTIQAVDAAGLPVGLSGNSRVICEPDDMGVLAVQPEAFVQRHLIGPVVCAWEHVEVPD